MRSLFVWFFALSGTGAAMLFAPESGPWPSLGAALLTLVAPGLLLQELILPGPRPAHLRLAATFLLPWALHGCVGLVAGSLESPILIPLLVSALLPGAIWLLRRPRVRSGRSWNWDSLSVSCGALALLTAAFALSAPPTFSLGSDVYAHIAGVTACLDEDLVFPEHEFHGPEFGLGTDPRFGTAHALLGALRWISGADPSQAWRVHTAVSAVGLVLAVGALAGAAFTSLIPQAVVLLGFLGLFSGNLYNPFEIAAYPLWLGLGAIFLMWGVLIPGGGRPRSRGETLLATLIAAGCASMHALAYILLALFAVSSLLSAHGGQRKSTLVAWLRVAMLSLPFLGLRIAISYGNVNPIHQKPWNVLAWSDGLYSVNPLFVAGFLGPVGIAVAVASFWLVGRKIYAENFALRWSLVASWLALAWISIPFLLTPTIGILGFLPLRFVMLILFPIPLAAFVSRAGPLPRRQFALALILLVALGVSTARQLLDIRQARSGPDLQAGEWSELRERLDALEPGVLLSDPYTMLAVAAVSPLPIVAVPDGRSSPRDPEPVERLRDSWRALSPCVDDSTTGMILRDRSVEYVLLQHDFGSELHGYEYALDPDAFPSQREKFRARPDRFETVWQSKNMQLFAVVDGALTLPSPEVEISCLCEFGPAFQDSTGMALQGGYRISAARVRYSSRERSVFVEGRIDHPGESVPADRRLVVRLDAVESPVPDVLRPIEKPVRKLLERVRRVRYRVRWTTLPSGGACPLWMTQDHRAIDLDLVLPLSTAVPPGRYRVTLQAADLSEFTPLRWPDLVSDTDVYSGPTLGEVDVE